MIVYILKYRYSYIYTYTIVAFLFCLWYLFHFRSLRLALPFHFMYVILGAIFMLLSSFFYYVPSTLSFSFPCVYLPLRFILILLSWFSYSSASLKERICLFFTTLTSFYTFLISSFSLLSSLFTLYCPFLSANQKCNNIYAISLSVHLHLIVFIPFFIVILHPPPPFFSRTDVGYWSELGTRPISLFFAIVLYLNSSCPCLFVKFFYSSFVGYFRKKCLILCWN